MSRLTQLLTETRASSINIEYILTLSVALIMLSGLAGGFSSITGERQEDIEIDTLQKATNEVAAQLTHEYNTKQQYDATSQYVNSNMGGRGVGNYEVMVFADTPDLFNSEEYVIEIGENGEYINATTTSNGELYTVSTKIDSAIPVTAGSGAPGGEVAIVYQSGAYKLMSQAEAEKENI